MEKSDLVYCYRVLTFEEVKCLDWPSVLDTRTQEVYEKLQITHDYILQHISNITSLNFSKNTTVEWKYICLCLYLIKLLSNFQEKSNGVFLSVQETKDFNNFLRIIVHIGISTKLQPNLPFYCKSKYPEIEDIFWNYNMLKVTIFGLTEFLKLPVLRFSIIPECLKEILVGLYQICYCPLKKPDNTIMTHEMYNKLLGEQQFYLNILNYLRTNIHPNIFVKYTMTIFHKNSPNWFKKQVSQSLTNILRSKNGVEQVAVALFADQENDTTRNWQILEVFSKLILSCKTFPDFKRNICKQLVELLHKNPEENTFVEQIFIHCTKVFYKEDPELCKTVFIREIVAPFIHFTYTTHKFVEDNITTQIKLTSRLLHGVFQLNTVGEIVIPIDILKPIINVVFKFYSLTLDSSFKIINNDLKHVLLLYFDDQILHYLPLFDRLIFNLNCEEILPFRNDVVIEIDTDSIKVKISEYAVRHSSTESCENLIKLIKHKSVLFGYLLNCITNEQKYFQRANEDLLLIEDELMSEYLERKVTVYKLLSELAEDKQVQSQLNENPTNVIQYICKVLDKTIQSNIHLSNDVDSEDVQSVFTVLIILENILRNSKNVSPYTESLSQPLKIIYETTTNGEMKELIKGIMKYLQTNELKNFKSKHELTKSELDTAIDDICDSLLPTRGHGLLTLTKLIEKKDKGVMERKQFILNVLQQNLANEDSFIYLSAINGLASLADIFPDTILKILCEEYSDSHRKNKNDSNEVKMKIGEVLVKVSKILGDMAPKYKPLLLNTFLIVVKDDDDLIRASSLSNLGEICRVLGYKLGTMFTEVLYCVHSIIATDKSPQARRSAVTVIRQLFIGLDQEIIAFFKDDILPVYRTLKHIYNNDADDVIRLQAQLALEELNESMKNFVFPKPSLNLEKKTVMLD